MKCYRINTITEAFIVFFRFAQQPFMGQFCGKQYYRNDKDDI